MPKTEKEGPEQEPEQIPDWGVTEEGRVIMGGEDVTDLVNPEYDEGDETPAEPPEPAVEGEDLEEKEPEKKETEESEQEKEEDETPSEKPEDPEVPPEPDKWKFNLKFRGDVEEKEYTQEQVQVRLQKLRAFEENEKEFWQQKREIEPYIPIIKSDWFREKLKEGYEAGELEKPPEPPAPPVGLTYEHLKRKADPDYEEIVAALASYAMGLDPKAAELLDTDLPTFLKEYDRFAKEVREGKKTAPPEEQKKPPKTDPAELKKKLELKEIAKEKANVVKPGSATDPPNPVKVWEKKYRELQKELRKRPDDLNLAASILDHRAKHPDNLQ